MKIEMCGEARVLADRLLNAKFEQNENALLASPGTYMYSRPFLKTIEVIVISSNPKTGKVHGVTVSQQVFVPADKVGELSVDEPRILSTALTLV